MDSRRVEGYLPLISDGQSGRRIGHPLEPSRSVGRSRDPYGRKRRIHTAWDNQRDLLTVDNDSLGRRLPEIDPAACSHFGPLDSDPFCRPNGSVFGTERDEGDERALESWVTCDRFGGVRRGSPVSRSLFSRPERCPIHRADPEVLAPPRDTRDTVSPCSDRRASL